MTTPPSEPEWLDATGRGVKVCSYCGRKNDPDAANCRECGTTFAVPAVASLDVPPWKPFSRTTAALLTLAIVYAPYSWLLLVRDSWSYRLTWLKLWPALPGFMVWTLTDIWVTHQRLRNALPSWAPLFFGAILTVVDLGFVWAIATYSCRWRGRLLLALALYNLGLGIMAYLLFLA